MSRTWNKTLSILAVPALALIGLGASVETAAPPAADTVTRADDVVLIDYRKVHEETGAGADSGVSPDGVWLSYSSSRSGNREIYAVHTETGEVKNLTNTPEDDWEARWHPDGTHLVYTARREGQNGVFILDLETNEEITVMSTKAGYEDYPSFSKDGSMVSFTAGPMGTREVYTWDWASGEIKTLTRGHNYVGSTNFSADGTQVVYHAYYGGSYNSEKADIFLVDADGGRGENITHNDDVWVYKAQWSPEGDWIAFSARYDTPNFNLWVMRPDGSQRTKITDQADEDFRWADWTTDGRLAWHGIRAQEGRLYGMNMSTGEKTDMAFSEDFVHDLQLSPDASSLLYEMGGDIYVTDADPGSIPLLVAEGTEPRYSENGESVVFLRERRTKMGTVSVEGGRVRTTDHDGSDQPRLGTMGVESDPVVAGDFRFFSDNQQQRVSYYITNESVVGRMQEVSTEWVGN